MKERERAEKVLKILKNSFPKSRQDISKRNSFETLVATILSQNTSDANTAKAFNNLSQQFDINPKVLANADVSKIEQAIGTAGLFRVKSKTIRLSSCFLIEKYEGSLEPIFSMPIEQARHALMEFPGVGPKTADVVLLFYAKQPTIPVDRHVNRVAKRLGFAPQEGDYESVRVSLQTLFKPADYLSVHLILIAHGRKTCKANRPICSQCPVCSYCPSCRSLQTD